MILLPEDHKSCFDDTIVVFYRHVYFFPISRYAQKVNSFVVGCYVSKSLGKVSIQIEICCFIVIVASLCCDDVQQLHSLMLDKSRAIVLDGFPQVFIKEGHAQKKRWKLYRLSASWSSSSVHISNTSLANFPAVLFSHEFVIIVASCTIKSNLSDMLKKVMRDAVICCSNACLTNSSDC